MAFIKVPITGTGSIPNDDLFRADLPPGVPRSSAQIPSNPKTGAPVFGDAYVWVDDLVAARTPNLIVPDAIAKMNMTARDAAAEPDKLDLTMRQIVFSGAVLT